TSRGTSLANAEAARTAALAAQYSEYGRGRAIGQAEIRAREAESFMREVALNQQMGIRADDKTLALEAAANDRAIAERATIAALLDESAASRVAAALTQEKAAVSENYARDIVAAMDRGDTNTVNQLAAEWTARSQEFDAALSSRGQMASAAGLLGVTSQNSLIDAYNYSLYGTAQVTQRAGEQVARADQE